MSLEFWEMGVLKLENTNEAGHGDLARTKESLKSQIPGNYPALYF